MCDCLEKVTRAMQEKYPGTSMALNLMVSGPDAGKARAMLATMDAPKEPGKRRVKAPNMLPTYCPFCGKKYGGES